MHKYTELHIYTGMTASSRSRFIRIMFNFWKRRRPHTASNAPSRISAWWESSLFTFWRPVPPCLRMSLNIVSFAARLDLRRILNLNPICNVCQKNLKSKSSPEFVSARFARLSFGLCAKLWRFSRHCASHWVPRENKWVSCLSIVRYRVSGLECGAVCKGCWERWMLTCFSNLAGWWTEGGRGGMGIFFFFFNYREQLHKHALAVTGCMNICDLTLKVCWRLMNEAKR